MLPHHASVVVGLMVLVRRPAPWRGWPKEVNAIRQKISFPFAGIGGPDRACYEGEWAFDPVNVFDKEPRCVRALAALHGEDVAKLNDILSMSDSEWEDSDGLVAGFPCQTHSLCGLGAGLSEDDPRVRAFFRLLDVIEMLSKRPRPLKWIMLENVRAFAMQRARGNAFNALMQIWEARLPAFTSLQLWSVSANIHSGVPMSRGRSMMISVARDMEEVAGTPDMPREIPPEPLENFLLEAESLPQRLLGTHLPTIAHYRRLFKSSNYADSASNLAVFDASRKVHCKWRQSLSVGCMPCIRTHTNSYFVVSRTPTTKVPDSGRYIDLAEMTQLSGVCPESVAGILSDAELVFSLGNMIPVDLAGVTLQEIMRWWVRWESRMLMPSMPMCVAPTGLADFSSDDETVHDAKRCKTDSSSLAADSS